MKTKVRFYVTILIISALLSMPVSAATASPPSNANPENSIQSFIQVTTLEDNENVDGLCSLREAIRATREEKTVDACVGGLGTSDTITFAFAGTITLAMGQLVIPAWSDDLIIDGAGQITINGENSSRIFFIEANRDVFLQNLSLTAGNATDGGAINNSGNLIILNSTLSGNHANSSNGGAIYNTGTVSIANSTLSSNQATYGGGIYSDGSSSSVVITNSTLSGNVAQQQGAGIYSKGRVYLTNATLTNNAAGDRGGGVYLINDPNSSYDGLLLRNSILAGNTSVGTGPECFATTAVVTDGYNLVGNTAGCAIYPWPGDLTNVDPKLGPLQDNGGSTATHALLPGSLAIDHGNRNGCYQPFGGQITTDQRGLPRSNRCDIGAFELQPTPIEPGSVFMPLASRQCSSRLYFDDFSNPESGWKRDPWQYAYLNNEYQIRAQTPDDINAAWVSSFPGFKATNYVVTVDVRFATDVLGWAGILFSFAPDWSNFYYFAIDHNGHYVIWEWNQQTSPWLTNGYSSAIHRDLASNQIKLERNGSMIWAYANGELLTIIKDSTYTGIGFVGLMTVADPYMDPNQVDSRYDNFTVEPISCGRSANYP